MKFINVLLTSLLLNACTTYTEHVEGRIEQKQAHAKTARARALEHSARPGTSENIDGINQAYKQAEKNESEARQLNKTKSIFNYFFFSLLKKKIDK